MLKYDGINYNLDCLIQFQVLRQFLEALAKKQLNHDTLLYGNNYILTENNINQIQDSNLNDNNDNNEDINDKNSKDNIDKRESEKLNDINEVIDLYGLKEGIKKNNELILSLSKKVEELQKNGSSSSPEEKKQIKKGIESINKENKKKFNYYEERINELNRKIETLNSNNENHLGVVENSTKEFLELINSNKKEINKNRETIENIKKSINEYINGKINKIRYTINEDISKKLEEYNENLKETIQINVDKLNDKINKINITIREHEERMNSFDEIQNKTFKDFSNKIDSLITFKNDQKVENAKFRQEISSLKLMSENFSNNLFRINELLESDNLQSLLSNLNSFSNKIVNAEEYRKTIQLINNHLKELQSENNEYRRYFEDILPLIGKITTEEDLKKLEQLLRSLLEEQNANAQKKYMDKAEVIKNIKNIMSKIKTLMSEYDKDRNADNCMLASKPINGYRCASCETYIGNLKNNTQFIPWNKFQGQEMILKPYRKGNGFSHFLLNINLDNSFKNNSIHEEEDDSNFTKKNNTGMTTNSSVDKVKNNSKILPSVNNINPRSSQKLNNIVEIKGHFNAEDNSNSKINNKYFNTYFTKTEYNTNKSHMGDKNKSNCLLARRIKRNNQLTYPNNSNINSRTIINGNGSENILNVNKVTSIDKISTIDKINLDSSRISKEKKKDQIYKKIYENFK